MSNKPTNDSSTQKYLPFRPVILCLVPICWILLNKEQYAITFYQPAINSIWWLLVPAVVSAALLYTKNFYLVLFARGLAVLQLGWIKVIWAEIKKDRDILLDISEIIKIRRIWNKTELQDKIKGILNDYSIIPHPKTLSEITEQCDGSIVEATRLTEEFVLKLLNPPMWKTALVFLSQNVVPIGLTVLSAVISAQIYKWWQTPNVDISQRIDAGALNTADLARTTSSQISALDVTVRHHSRIIDQQNRNISGIESDLRHSITNRIQPEIEELASQDTKLSAAIDRLNNTALGMDIKIRQNENTLLGMSATISAIKRIIGLS